MTRLPTLALLGLALMTLAPAAMAADDPKPDCPDGTVATPEGCSQQAWVDDCPPDMMCAADAPKPDGNATGDEPVGTGDRPVQYGPDGCIDCTGPIDSHAGDGSCMDGTATDCRDDVQYLGGEPGRGPADCENCRDLEAEGASHEAAGIGAAALLAAAAGAVLVARRR